MYEEKVSAEQAKLEFETWLDAKRVKPEKREKYADMIESIVYGIIYGQVTVDPDTKVITQHLAYPIQDSNGATVLSKLDYKPRLRTQELQDRTKGIDPGDGIGRLCAIAGALTGNSTSMISKLDTEDYEIARSVAVFFL